LPVTWNLITVAVTGVVLGNCVRAPGLLAATALAILAAALAGGFDGLSGGDIVLAVLLVVATLQVSYVLGVFVSLAWQWIMARLRGS
jgi:hypothetical protein